MLTFDFNLFIDQRRMKEIRMYLTRLRLNADKIDKPKREREVC